MHMGIEQRPAGRLLGLQARVMVTWREWWQKQIDLESVLLSCDCCNKLLQTLWLKITETYSPIILEATSPKSRFWRGHAPAEGSREGSFPESSSFWWWWPSILGVPRPVAASLQSLHPSSHRLCLCVSSLLFIRTLVTGVRIPDFSNLILITNYICEKPISK